MPPDTSARSRATAPSWIAERIRRAVSALQPDLMGTQFPEVHEELWIKGYATRRIGIDPHHPATHPGIELVIPATVERIGEVDTPSVAAHLHHLRRTLDCPPLGM